MAKIIQIRRDTSTNWSTINPTLAQGELGYETDTGKLKIGDGTTDWNNLPYFAGGGGSGTDELVKADSSDPNAGYLSDKVDNSTIEVDTVNHYIKVKNNVFAPYSHTHQWSDVSKTGSSIADLETRNMSDINVNQDIDWNGYKITNVADPVNAQDVATKNYVDNNAGSSTDEMVKVDSSDPSAGYLTDKVDNFTIVADTDEHKIKFGDDCVIFPAASVNDVQRVSIVDSKSGLIIPYYEYPWDSGNSTWKSDFIDMITNLKRLHDFPVIVVLNPSSGPGSSEDSVYRRAIKMLHGAGCMVVGYVDTNYTNNSISTVETDIDNWKSLYPDIDGIFLDRMTSDDDATHRSYYTQLNMYCHNNGLIPTVGNAGAVVGGAYFKEWCADIIIVHENNVYPNESDLAGGDWEDSYREIKYWRKAALVYSQANIDKEQFRMMQKYCGFIFVTSSSDYSSLPSYLMNEFVYCSMYDWPSDYIDDPFKIGARNAYFTLQEYTTTSSTVTIDWNKGNKVKLTLTQNATLTFVDPPGACNLALILQQDSNGGHNVTFPSSVKWASGVEVTPTTDPNAVDVVSILFDGTTYYASASYDFN